MNERGKPETVGDLYPSPWLHADDLDGRRVRVTVARVDIEGIRQRDGTIQPRAVVTFEKATKRLILNKTQCQALLKVAGSERFAEWPGVTATLSEGRAPNGKPTIVIGAAE